MRPDVIGGRYRVGEAIGQGGMGMVWLCRDETLQRDVAVKQVGLLPGESVTDSARALREARSSAALSHRNVVTVFDVVEEDRSIWLVMEYIPGRSLADLVRDDGRLDPVRVADIGAQVADGMAAAHAAGTIHRDIKPGNVLVRGDGVAKISDFGIARVVGDPALTQSGLLTGTPGYFSPEIARGASPAQASDVWALGATLYAAVEGRPPYRLQQPVAVLHEISTSQPPPPQHADFLEPVLLRMLDRDPDLRWTMADAAHALHRLVREHSPREQTLAVTRSNQRPARPSAAAVSAAAAAAATGRSTERGSDGGSDRGPHRSGGGPAVVASSREQSAAPLPSARPTRATGGGDGRGRRLLLALLALAALAAVVVGGVYLAGLDDETSSPGASPTASSSGASTPSTQPSASDTPSETPSESASESPSPSESESESESESGGSDGATPGASGTGLSSTEKETFVRAYFATAPGGSDAAWARLGPGLQAQGRARYDGFWSTVSSVDVGDVQPVAGTDDVEASVTYRTTDGRVSSERKRLELIESPDGGWLINTDQPAG